MRIQKAWIELILMVIVFTMIPTMNPIDDSRVDIIPETNSNEFEISEYDKMVPVLSWISNENKVPTPVESNFIIECDVIVLIVQLPDLDDETDFNIVKSTIDLETVEGEVIYTTNFEGSRISFNTRQYLDSNLTISVHLTGTLEIGKTLEYHFENLTVNNFFSPDLTSISERDIGDNILEVNWTIFDRNQREEHYSDLLLSADDGVTYQLIAKSLSDASYHWNRTGFLERDTYRFSVRVYDNDPHKNPNPSWGAYWPGLSDTIESISWHSTSIPPPVQLEINSPRDIEYLEGETENYITWRVYFPDHQNREVDYTIERNQTVIQDGLIFPGVLTISVDGLTVGTHVFTIKVDYGYVSDDVLVKVLPRAFSLVDFSVGFMGGSVLVMSIFGVLIFRAMVRKEGFWQETTILELE